MSSGKRSMVRWLRYPIAAAIFYYLFVFFRQNLSDLGDTDLAFGPSLVVLAYLAAFVCFLLNIWSWKRITSHLSIEIEHLDTLAAWQYSQLGKYLPGKIWLFLGRIEFYRDKGKSRPVVASALLLEMSIRLLAGVVLFLATWSHHPAVTTRRSLLAIAIGAGVLLATALHPRVFQFLFSLGSTILKREPLNLAIGPGSIARILGLEIAAYLISGVGLSLLIGANVELNAIDVLRVAGALSIAGVLGAVAVFVPSGLGVREGILTFLLSTLMPVSLAFTIAIVARLWLTTAELLFTAAVFSLKRFSA